MQSPSAGDPTANAITSLGGIRTSCLDRRQLALLVGDICHNWTPGRPPFLIFSLNGQALSLAGTNPAYRDILNTCDLVHADGQSMVVLSRWFGPRPISERSATTDFIHDIPRHCAAPLKHYFLGATPAVVETAATLYGERYSNVDMVGARDGYFSAEEELAVIEQINRSGADILWVGLGKPKEQQFCIRHKAKLNVAVVISCGGCFNFLAGDYQRAPHWMQRSGLEWLHRLLQNPRKLFWRYFITNFHSIFLAVKYRHRDAPGMPPGKILFLLKTFAPGGVERVSLNLAASLRALGYQPEFYVFFDSEDGIRELRKDWPVTLVNPQRSLRPLAGAFLQLRRYVRDNQVQVVISAKETANLISLLALMLLPRVVRLYTRHCAFDVADQQLSPGRIKALYCLYALTRCRIVAVSEDLARQIRTFLLFGRRKVVARANPIIDERIFKLAEEPTPIAGEYICAVGRLCEQKGFDILLQAYQYALQLEPALPRLVIVGEGENRAALEQQAAALGIAAQVTFFGYTPNPYAIIKRARLFVLSSRHEGLPTALVEAMALGVPVVASDCATGPRELLEGGRHGELVAVQNAEALALAMVVNIREPIHPQAAVVNKYRYRDAALAYTQLFGEMTPS